MPSSRRTGLTPSSLRLRGMPDSGSGLVDRFSAFGPQFGAAVDDAQDV